eukprot:1161845-Pelagomonas_calceolata.AAC.3
MNDTSPYIIIAQGSRMLPSMPPTYVHPYWMVYKCTIHPCTILPTTGGHARQLKRIMHYIYLQCCHLRQKIRQQLRVLEDGELCQLRNVRDLDPEILQAALPSYIVATFMLGSDDR